MIEILKGSPPAATHPINGGKAPVKAPGTTAKAVTRFRYVYTPLYQIIVTALIISAGKLPAKKKRKLPEKKQNAANIAAPEAEIFPDGRGLFFVLFIFLSVSISWSWFITEAVIPINSTAAVTRNSPDENSGRQRKYPMKPERLTGIIIFSFDSKRQFLKIAVLFPIKCLQIFNDFSDIILADGAFVALHYTRLESLDDICIGIID